MDPNFAIARYELGQAYQQKHMYDEAIEEFTKAIQLAGDNEIFKANLAYAYASSGKQEEALQIIKDLEDQQNRNSSADANIALIYVGLGNRDQAIIWLEKAYEARFNPSILLRPAFDPLRSDPRFQNLARRIGLPSKDENSKIASGAT